MKRMMIYLSLFLTACLTGSIVSQAQSGAAAIVGTWRNGSISLLQNRNRVTGATSAANGKTFSYRFDANGRYQFTGYMESTMYNCSTNLFQEVTGTYEVEGDELTLTQRTNIWRKQNSCAPSSNMEKPGELKTETYRFSTRRDASGREQFCLAQSDGTDWCFQKRNDE